MEANFFRCLARELAPRLEGARVEKVFNPAPGVWTFKVRTSGGGSFLLNRADQRGGLLFLTTDKPANPERPTARCMWFRKRLSGRMLGPGVTHWPDRALALPLSRGEEGWLVLSCVAEPEIVDALPEGFGAEPAWPDAVPRGPGAWREYPQLTPPLRRLLSASPEGRAEALLGAVRRGGCAGFFLYGEGEGAEILAWRLPEALAAGRPEQVFDAALDAADHLGRMALFPHLRDLAEAGERAALGREARRLEKALASVARDRERLRAMAALAEDGEALRGVLYAHGKEERPEEVEVPLPDGGTRTIRLDPRLNVAGNMERLFARAAKGRRGLAFVDSREAELAAMLEEVRAGRMPEAGQRRVRAVKGEDAPGAKPRERKGLAAFRTSDGFLVLRGKNAQGNREARVSARAWDLWFHARGGPGAHAVLRRDYPDQEVPESSLREAATLAALRSFASGQARADVICALVRHVHSVKGAGPGTVTVDREFAALSVDLDPELEKRLAGE
ncbi:NFACT RNA binding domain-containing protein [Desulfocurvus sp. DL9XJH121]